MSRHFRRRPNVPLWHAGFLAMLPAIRTYARIAFRDLKPEAREEAVQEAICNALAAYVNLFSQGRVALAYPSVLARFAVAQTRDHRKVGGHLNCRDVLSEYCQREKDITVERLDQYEKEDEAWLEVVVEDKHAGPADVAATRIDFSTWLRRLPCRLRRVAKFLANGETTTAAAEKFNVSAGRISQLRQELQESWQEFLGEVNAEKRNPKVA